MSFFKMIRLETIDERFVRNAQIPAFMPGAGPDVILWGNRAFLKSSDEDVYREGFLYPLIDIEPATGPVIRDI